MVQPQKAILLVDWKQGSPEPIPVQYNPTELNFEKSVQFAEVTIPGLDSPLQQFVRGQSEKLTLELFFDTTDKGMGAGATSVTTLTDKIYQLVKVVPEQHAPPVCTFIWSEHFPGSSLGAGATSQEAGTVIDAVTEAVGGVAGAVIGAVGTAVETVTAALGAAGVALGNQRRNGFKCVVESVRQKFTLFSPKGVPLRATLTVTLREYSTLAEQLARLNLTSPDRTHAHVVQQGDTLSAIADRYYGRPLSWRAIADENNVEDPRRLRAGTPLTVPSLR